jgi:hypothetical protein
MLTQLTLFAWLQIFNLVVSRRINDEYNFFEGLHKSTLFLIILAIIVFCQVGGGLPVFVKQFCYTCTVVRLKECWLCSSSSSSPSWSCAR